MKRCLSSAVLAVLLLAACGDDDDTANVRAVALSPDAETVDFFVDQELFAGEVGYGDATDYEEVDVGAAELSVEVPSGTAAGALVTLEDGDYTVLAIGFASGLAALVLQDDNEAPDGANARLRIVHAAPSAPTLDVYVTSAGETLRTPTITGLAYGEAAPYLVGPNGNYQVRMTPTGTTDVIVNTGGFDMDVGQVRTIIARDAEDGGAPFGTVTLRDRD